MLVAGPIACCCCCCWWLPARCSAVAMHQTRQQQRVSGGQLLLCIADNPCKRSAPPCVHNQYCLGHQHKPQYRLTSTPTTILQGGPSGSRLGTMFLEKSNGTRTEVCFKMLGIRQRPDRPNPAKPAASQQQQQRDASNNSGSSSSSQISAEAAAGAPSALGNLPATATQYGYATLNRAQPWSVKPGSYAAVQGSWAFRLVNLRFIYLPWVKDMPRDGCCREDPSTGAAAGTVLEDALNAASTGAEAAGAAHASVKSQLPAAQQASSSSSADAAPAGIPDAVAQAAMAETAAEPERYTYFNATPAMVQMEREVRAAVRKASSQAAATAADDSSSSSSWRGVASFASYGGSSSSSSAVRSKSTPQQVWQVLKDRYRYADGQEVFDSLYRPCYAETKGMCVETCG